MLEKIKELGLEKFAGDEELADQFVAGFVAHVMLEKEAQEVEAMQKEAAGPGVRKPDLTTEYMSGIAHEAGKASAGFAGNMAVGALVGGFRLVKDQFRYQRFLKALEQAISNSHTLREANRQKVGKYADTIYRFAPLVAVDPNLLQSVLTNAILGDGIDLMTIKSLTDLQGRYSDNASLNPKSWV